jgi:hypothetical protein
VFPTTYEDILEENGVDIASAPLDAFNVDMEIEENEMEEIGEHVFYCSQAK